MRLLGILMPAQVAVAIQHFGMRADAHNPPELVVVAVQLDVGDDQRAGQLDDRLHWQQPAAERRPIPGARLEPLGAAAHVRPQHPHRPPRPPVVHAAERVSDKSGGSQNRFAPWWTCSPQQQLRPSRPPVVHAQGLTDASCCCVRPQHPPPCRECSSALVDQHWARHCHRLDRILRCLKPTAISTMSLVSALLSASAGCMRQSLHGMIRRCGAPLLEGTHQTRKTVPGPMCPFHVPYVRLRSKQ